MPNSETHKIIGGLAGLASLHFLSPLSPGGGPATLAGRIVGGVVGTTCGKCFPRTSWRSGM